MRTGLRGRRRDDATFFWREFGGRSGRGRVVGEPGFGGGFGRNFARLWPIFRRFVHNCAALGARKRPSLAGGVSFYREHLQPIFTRRCPSGGRDGNGQLEDYDEGAGL